MDNGLARGGLGAVCGICGELRLDGAPADLGAVAIMMERLERRGPDHGGSYSDGTLGMGHRRLAIVDLSTRSNQPMVDPELGLALVFNGTIYNYRELRQELQGKGYRFFSDGDSETILKAWHAWGEDCVEHLHGMFAFAVWDQSRRVLFLARDRFGIKPLYWSRQNDAFRFASNTHALLEAGCVDTGIDAVNSAPGNAASDQLCKVLRRANRPPPPRVHDLPGNSPAEAFLAVLIDQIGQEFLARVLQQMPGWVAF